MNRNRGKFIVIEGLEGAGKTTAIKTIQEYLQAKQLSVIVTREPGGTRVGDVVRSLLKNHVPGEVLDSRTELLLLYAARVQHVTEVITPALNQGTWVISDRFELSTLAYQGGGRGIDRGLIHQISAICLQGFAPDLTFFLDIHPEQGLHRVNQRGQADRIESESLEFFDKVSCAYHQEIAQMSNVLRIDASQALEIVQQSIVEQLADYCGRIINPGS